MIAKHNLIKNKIELVYTPSREKAAAIIEAGIAAVLPASIMHTSICCRFEKNILSIRGQDFDIANGRIFVVGGGKAAGTMAASLEDILGPGRITDGIVVDKYGITDNRTKQIIVRTAGHPVPDENGAMAVQEMLQIKERYALTRDDIVICLISGGGSALLPYPVEGVTLAEKQQTTRLLLSSGADITEINCVRKHLSKVKGGQFGRHFTPATVISLILSDVIGNDLSVIASGPTYPDQSTYTQAMAVLIKYGLQSQVPETVLKHLELGAAGKVGETPKILTNCHNFIIGDNSLALENMRQKAVQLGLKPLVLTAEQKGDTAVVARYRANEIKTGKYAGYDTLLLGGETTPVLPHEHGHGGRNQHYAAVSLTLFKEYPGKWLVASVGTDGSDFMSEIAGAMVDNNTQAWLESHHISPDSYIALFDSYGLLSQVSGSIVKTGNTGTNVGDVMVYLLG
jgi:glycerate 2-kinase